jgi:ElaB/YqjD/DUF883 family membrane-anchored ribosome-binding protein
MAAEKHQKEGRSHGGGESADGKAVEGASEAMQGLRSVVEQVSQTLRKLTEAGERWAREGEHRASDLAKELASEGERAVGGVSRQVEQNPLISLAVAFAVGFLCASLIRR